MTIQQNVNLSDILWYKIGGTANYLLRAESEADIKLALEFIEANHLKKTFICGLGSNLIFPDGNFDGAVIQITGKPEDRQITAGKDGLVTAFAGETLDTLIQFSFENNLLGLEWAGGLPGTIGAGVRGNVGAFGGELKDSFVSANILEQSADGIKSKTITKANFHFSYRNSLVKQQKNLIIVSAAFRLHPAAQEAVEQAKQIYQNNIQYRKTHHPMDYPSCGSVFKNISEKENVQKILTIWPDINASVETKWHGKVAMGYIIHRLGLTGYQVGNMQVSDKHSNFIINLGGGKAQDALAIIQEIKTRVKETFNFTPEVEVEIVK